MTRIGFSAPSAAVLFSGNSWKTTQHPAPPHEKPEATPVGKQRQGLFSSIITLLREWLGQRLLTRQQPTGAPHASTPAPVVQEKEDLPPEDSYDAKLISILENEGGPTRQD